jgi:alpha-tubulin suppressor-like RCC1 family protein
VRASLTIALALLLAAAIASKAQVSGDATITAPVFGLPLTVTTSSQYAGAISSLKWNGKEFVDDWDHGRQFQSNAQFFNRYECYNPYEAGSKIDAQFPTTSSRLLALTASGNTLESTTQMAWYVAPDEAKTGVGAHCGDPNQWLPAPAYTAILSDYEVHKKVTIGFAGIENVIEHWSDVYIPEQVKAGLIQITEVMPYEFSNVWSYDVVSKSYRNIRAPSGEDDQVKVMTNADGSYAMAFYSPELLQPYGNGTGMGYRWGLVFPDSVNYPEPNYACAGVGSVDHFDSFNGPSWASDRAYLVIGNMDQVKQGLDKLHFYFRALDPDVFNWREYVALNHLALTSQQAAENHWLTQGIAQGLRASRTFSAPQYLQLNPDVSVASYEGAIDHYVGGGRSEGRGTTATIGTGMQHTVSLTNRSVTGAGQNFFGQLGNGSTATSSGPGGVTLDKSVTEIASGDYTSFAVKSDGSLWVWGSNQYGARGDGSSGDNVAMPVKVQIPAPITSPSRAGKHAVAVGSGSYAAIDMQGYVWTWGANWNGRLGDGSFNARYFPARVKKSSSPNDYLTGIVSITAGGGTMAALDADGTVWTWGAGAGGTLGNGSAQDSYYPVQVVQARANGASTPLVAISQVSCGSSGFCMALARYGQVFGWGNNDLSQLGIAPGGSVSIATPITVGRSDIAVDAIAAGAAHAIAHSLDGNVYGWGYNGRGQLGTGSAGVAQFPPAPMNAGPDGMNEISHVAAGADFSVMVRELDRAVFVTGDNQSAQLALPGNPQTQYVPARTSFAAP